MHDIFHWWSSKSILYLRDSLQNSQVIEVVIKQICHIQNCNNMTLKIISRPVQQQLNDFDCGGYVVAQADDLANNIDPTNNSYKTQNTQHHLSRCLERGSLEPFPTTDKRTKCSKAVEAVLQLLNTFFRF